MTTSTGHLALARKYRPRTLAEIVGQPGLVRTLANAIAGDRVHHAYLFTGPRGCGKTSTARILARSLNCEKGPTADPCGTCEQCRAILEDRHMDVIEMDAASRTGVDDIREVLDGVAYAPVTGRRKIYIVDEVHMLSKNAFNALLKTLEEPPAHVHFVFATTEPRKLPATVVSRCQSFHLRHVAHDLLSEHFARIVEAEGRTAEPDAIAMIARAAEGSVRDGLSILDQAFSTCPGKIDAESVRTMLGLTERRAVDWILRQVLARRPDKAIAGFRKAVEGGADPATAIKDMMERVHDLTVLAFGATAGVALTGDDLAQARAAAEEAGAERLHAAWTLLVKGFQDVQAAPDPAQAADMVILRLCAA